MTNEAQRQPAQQEIWAADLRALRRHLPAMQASQAELSHGAGQLSLAQGTATSIYAWNGLNTLADLHAAAVSSLVQDHGFSARVLAQDAIQLAVNVVYVLDDPSGDRLTGALRHLLNAQSTRFAAWRAVAPDNEATSKRAEQLAAECRQSPWYASAPPWPPLGVRADAVGFGQWVHPVQAAAANAEQTMAQELMNFLQCERGPVEERQAAHAYRTARCEADALYVETVALHLFAQALHRMASAMKDTVAVLLAELAIERMDDVLADHQRLAEAHRDDKNIYMVVRGRGT